MKRDSGNFRDLLLPKPFKHPKTHIPPKRKRLRRKPLTCIVSLKSKDRVVLISDRCVTTDLDVRDRKKILTVWKNRFAVAGSGYKT
ncbi:hypothetical protein KAS14_06620 [Candidatus Bathyarchaeota archaeon]|nr:hypothetical protein [Candidatus Bathyarchaeota archaeon]